MKQLRLPVLILTLILLSTSNASANGMNHFARDMFLFLLIIPVGTIVLTAICALSLSKSRYAVFIYPVLAGLIVSIIVLKKIGAASQAYVVGPAIYTLTALCIGGLFFAGRVIAKRLRARDHQDSTQR
jgi:hypothetical protein